MATDTDVLRKYIETAYIAKQGGDDMGDVEPYLHEVIDRLDRGSLRVAELVGDEVMVHEWVKQAILLFFATSKVEEVELKPFEFADKIPLKANYQSAGVRVVPGALARFGSFIDRDVVLMPSFVNIGARIGAQTMIDTWATVGSCAQVGERVHVSGGVGIGGVLEPPQAAPVFIGNDAMLGSRSMIVEGARVGDGAVIGAGTILSSSIPVIDAETGEELSRGVVPPWCVAINATREKDYPGGKFGIACVLVVKRLEPGVRHDKSRLNELLREQRATL